MSTCYIKLKNATLSYPSSPYNALTLKEEVFKWLNLKKPTKIIYDIQALKNIDLSISEGERVGIIGRNGAGKSTLLKAIGGMYPLQSGTIETKGKIRAMFELSLGFEFEATGRENIVYRGLLLGETPKSINAKAQQIIEFAELGDFIDFPIKTYSSGMLVRLAFAISTTVNGDILLLDEVLGAGDAPFQIKAKKRMEDMMNNAKIIVLVSHDMNSIKRLCNRAVYLKNGKIIADGAPETITELYLNTNVGNI